MELSCGKEAQGGEGPTWLRWGGSRGSHWCYGTSAQLETLADCLLSSPTVPRSLFPDVCCWWNGRHLPYDPNKASNYDSLHSPTIISHYRFLRGWGNDYTEARLDILRYQQPRPNRQKRLRWQRKRHLALNQVPQLTVDSQWRDSGPLLGLLD